VNPPLLQDRVSDERTSRETRGGLRIVAPFGFYGWGNIGDESTLQGFAQLVRLREDASSVWVGSRNPAHTTRVAPSFRYFAVDDDSLQNRLARRWAHGRAAATVFPGGTPIMDGLGSWPLDEVGPLVRASHDINRPVAFVGVGTETLRRPESREIVASTLAPWVEHWTVRSVRDKERLTGWGVAGDRITVAADLAWLLGPQSATFGRHTLGELNLLSEEPLIGVNVNNEQVVLEREPMFFEKIAALLDRVIETRGARVLFFCSEVREGPSFDKAASQRVLALMKRRERASLLPNHYWTPQEMLSLIACCRTVISMRYHVCLFSALQAVPFVAIQRSDKVRDLCADIEWPFGMPLGGVDESAMLEQIEEIERRHGDLTTALRRATELRATASLRNHVALDALAASVRSRQARGWLS
jgi:polysaccharide pyruvyl transferase WcaK-like protein